MRVADIKVSVAMVSAEIVVMVALAVSSTPTTLTSLSNKKPHPSVKPHPLYHKATPTFRTVGWGRKTYPVLGDDGRGRVVTDSPGVNGGTASPAK